MPAARAASDHASGRIELFSEAMRMFCFLQGILVGHYRARFCCALDLFAQPSGAA
jgi:hypothetical protein